MKLLNADVRSTFYWNIRQSEKKGAIIFTFENFFSVRFLSCFVFFPSCEFLFVFFREREVPPRFASHGQFEYEFGQRWKDLYAEERLRREALEREFQSAREQLAAQMDMAYEEYQAQHLREELRRRQEELERLEQGRMERLEKL